MTGRRLSRVPGAAATVAVLTVIAAVAMVLTGRHLGGVTAERDLARLAAQDVSVVAAALREEVTTAAVAASVVQRSDVAPALPDGVDGAIGVVARDSGSPVLSDADGGMVVVALYDTTAPPTTVQLRRDHVVGYLVTPLDLAPALGALAPDQGGIAVDGPEARVLSLPPSGPGTAVTHTVSFEPGAGPPWSVTVWGAPSRPSPMAWLLALLILVCGLATAGLIVVRQRASRRRQAELSGLQASNAAVASLAVLTQQSLDLGEALPALSTELSRALGLRGLVLTTATPEGHRPLFSWGAEPDDGHPLGRQTEVAGGETVWLRLARGGRTAARLWVVAGRDLDRHDLHTLVAAGELLAAVLTTAEAFAQQQNLVDRMQAVDELKSVFLATASHELRTPVVAIAGYSGVLNAKWESLGPEQARSLVERVDRSAQRLSRMVEDLLDFSRLERGHRLDDEESVLDLGDVVGQVLTDHPDLAQSHTVTYRPVAGVRVKGSRQALERVVTNLVGNAVKYSPEDTEVRVLVGSYDGLATLVVEDDGPGVPAADRDRIFSRFYRGRGDEVTRTRGAGLGLAIVTDFAASMGGRVSVEESASGGARFLVAFPPAEVATDLAHSAPHATTSTSPSASGATDDRP